MNHIVKYNKPRSGSGAVTASGAGMALSSLTGLLTQQQLATILEGYLLKEAFDDLFVKESDGRGGFRIKAKYALYSNQYLSCLGNNPDAGTVELGATTLGGLNNVAAAADEVSAAAKVLVREAGASSWTLKNLSDIVGLDTAALATYLSNNGYAKQSWVEGKGYLTQHQSLAGYATETWVQAQGYLTTVTKAQVEAVLTGDIASHTHSQYLTSALASQTYQPIGDYATNTALNSAVSTLNTAIGAKLDAATFDDLFAKESDGKGGYRIKAKYALYSPEYISCLGNNPDAGTTTPSTPGVDLDAVAAYLTQQGYATQSWVQAQGYLKAADLSAYALAEDAYLKTQQNRKSNAHTVASLTAVANSSDSWVNNYSFSLVNNNNALNFYVGGVQNERQALIQSGHSLNGYAQALGALHLNKLGGAVYINNSLALNAANVGSYAVTLDTAQTITGVKTLGTQVSTSTGNIDRLIIVPYKHTAGPWKINSYDTYGEAWLRFVYGAAETITFNHQGVFFANAIRKRGGTSSQFLKADGSVDGNNYALASALSNYYTKTEADGRYFRSVGSVPTAYVDLTNYNANVTGYANYQSGAYQVARSSSSELLVNLALNYGSASALQFYTSFGDGAALKYRKTIDANRVSGPWRTIITELNIGSYMSANASVLDGRYVNASGDTMTGALNIANTASHALINAQYNAAGAYSNVIWANKSEARVIFGSPSWATVELETAGAAVWRRTAGITYKMWDSGNDGPGSGLDADMLDGYHETAFVRSWWTASPGYDCASYNSRPLISFTYGKNAPFTGAFIDVVTKYYGFYLGTSYNSNGPLFYRRHGVSNDGGMGTWQQLARIGDNVASATRLRGTYSLWGQSFYGNNVSGNMTGVGNINSAAAPINTIYASNWYRSIGATGWYSETYGGGWYMSDTQWIRAHNNKGIFSQGEFLSGYCFVRDGYAGRSWNSGYGALGVGIINNEQQTPLVMAYRSGTAIDVEGANRLFSMELLNSGTALRFGFGGTLRFSFTSDGVFSSSKGMYSDGYMSCLGKNDGSDARLKNILGDVTLPIEVILNAPAVRFAWNALAGPTMAGKMAVGTIAQYWLEPLPVIVGTMPTGYYGIDYDGLNWVATKSLARYAYDGLTEHERRILALERENKELKSEINELKRRLA